MALQLIRIAIATLLTAHSVRSRYLLPTGSTCARRLYSSASWNASRRIRPMTNRSVTSRPLMTSRPLIV
ncbi:hypothetical protein T492DRAFT_941539 [Pavlovales sp. CCMP2436]|nr:hypothetical protein T492DRAFT_941539 [Pavlovales sp. CCMP2436]